MAFVKWTVFVGLTLLGTLSDGYGADTRTYDCVDSFSLNNDHYRLRTDKTRRVGGLVSWGSSYWDGDKESYAYCGYTNGHKIELTDIALWAESAHATGKGVWIYSGIGDHCSQGTLLMFNDLTELVMLVDTSTFVARTFSCKLH